MSGKQAKRKRREAIEAETAELMPYAVRLIRGAVDKLRQEYARRFRFIRRADPEGVEILGDALTPCETCAFRRTADFTDGDTAFLHTSCELVAAMESDKPFWCHYPKEEGDKEYRPKPIPCIGWMVLNSPIPGEFDVREFLGNEVVDLLVDGREMFNAKSQVLP